jgi:peptide/nickel transport system permease protein
MAGYVVRRMLWAVLLFFVVTLTVYVLYFVLPTQRDQFVRRTEANPEEVRQNLRIHGTVFQEYGTFVWNIVRHGFLGTSFVNREAVTAIIGNALPITLSLIVGGMIIWLLIAVPVGILSAMRPRSLLDRGMMIFVLLGISAHPVWIGLMLSYLLGFKWHFMPLGGYCSIFHPVGSCGGPVQWAYHMVLPWFTFAAYFAAIYARMIRASVIESYDEDYVRTARAKGMSERKLLRKHVLRNAMMPVVTMLGMDMGIAFGGSAAGAIFVENAFGLNGLGRTVTVALRRQDLPVILGVTVCVTTAVLLLNMLADILYAYIDPRIGHRSGRSGLHDPSPEIPTRASQPKLVSQGAQTFS